MKVPFEPYGTGMLVVPSEEPAERQLIVVPQQVKQEMLIFAEVVAIGPGQPTSTGCIPCQWKVGDRVMVTLAQAFEVVIEGQKYYYLDQSAAVGRKLSGPIFDASLN